MPSQPERLYQGEGREREREREREMYYIKRAAMQTNTGERLVRVRSAARMELETEA